MALIIDRDVSISSIPITNITENNFEVFSLDGIVVQVLFDNINIATIGYDKLLRDVIIEHTIDKISKIEIRFFDDVLSDDELFYKSKFVEVKWKYITGTDQFVSLGKFVIANVALHYDAFNSYVQITAYGADILTALDKKNRIFDNQTYSDMVEAIALEYGFDKKIDKTNERFARILQTNQTDYEFIRNIAIATSHLFFIENETLYFKHLLNAEKLDKSLSFLSQSGIFKRLDFSLNKIGTNRKTKQNIQKISKEQLSLSSSGKIGLIDTANVAKDESFSISDGDYIGGIKHTTEEINNIISALDLYSSFIVSADLEILGIPEIKAGRLITIQNVNRFSGAYLIMSCVHRIVQNIFDNTVEYTTSLYGIRNTIGDLDKTTTIGEDFVDVMSVIRNSQVIDIPIVGSVNSL